jgi:hypothetical protein
MMINREVRRLASKLVVLIALVTCLVAMPSSSAAEDCCCPMCYNTYLYCINFAPPEQCAEEYNNCANACNEYPEDPENPVFCPLM